MAEEEAEPRVYSDSQLGTVPEQTFTMPLSLAQAIVNYLQQRPYAEVNGLIAALIGLPPNGNGAVPDDES